MRIRMNRRSRKMATSPYDNLPTGKNSFDTLRSAGGAMPGISMRTAERLQSEEEISLPANNEAPKEEPAEDAEPKQAPDLPAIEVENTASTEDPAPKHDEYDGHEEPEKPESPDIRQADPDRENITKAEYPADEAAKPENSENISPYQPLAYEAVFEADESEPEGDSPDAAMPSPASAADPASSAARSEMKSADADYSKISLKNRCRPDEYILPFEETLLVPDTMPDMEKMLFAEGRGRLSQSAKSAYTSGDTLTGDITVYAVYAPVRSAESPVDVVKSSIPFATDKCWANARGNIFRVDVSVKTIEAEMVNERKFTVKGKLSLKVSGTDKRELTVFNGLKDDSLVQLHSIVNPSSLESEAEDSIDISQEITLNENQPSPARILKFTAEITENHRQITSGKLVINATVNSEILYGGEYEGMYRLSSVRNRTDFSQFIPINDEADTDLVMLSFNGDDLSVDIENQDKLLLHGQIKTSVYVYSNLEIPMVSDAYHRDRDISFDVSKEELSSIKGTVSGEVSAREVINLNESQAAPSALLCGSSRLSDIRCVPEGGRLVIDGSMKISILALDEEDHPFVIETPVTLRGSLDSPYHGRDLAADIYASVKDFWFDDINSRQVEVNVSVAIEVWVSSIQEFITLENICVGEPRSGFQRASMAIYVVGRGDSLWDIAKRYRSDTDFLAEINDIDKNLPLPEGMKLFIMR